MRQLATSIERESGMEHNVVNCGAFPVSVHVSRFQGLSGVDEYHLSVRPTKSGSIDTHLDWVFRAYQDALDFAGLDMQTAVLRRFFCSDLERQASALEARSFSNPYNTDEPCAVSWVRQPPVPTGAVALWAYHVSDPDGALDKTQEGTSLTLRRDGVSHIWTTGITSLTGDTSYDQTRGVFDEYNRLLQSRGLSLADNVMRTWLFVQDVDANYHGLVVARREFLAERGLTPETHFIASSGIEGTSANVAAKVTMDAYAISGVRPEQIEYLSAPDHLGPTHAYGVTFERATSVAYRDRKHIIISGTASIDPEGNVMYPGNVSLQLNRTVENIEALLNQAGATLEDMCVFVAYIREPDDHPFVWRQMRERFGDAPMQLLTASICRPEWLIEIEGMAIVPTSNPDLPAF
jgi:enamine deaminase RidA (YjgF/YER057c/UK114 family)